MYKIEAKRTSSLLSVKKRKSKKKLSFVFFCNKAKKNEYIRSSTIEDLPLLIRISPRNKNKSLQ